MMTYTDRHGRPLQIGQLIRVRECIGRYGQCATREGKLKSLSDYGGGTIELTKPATRVERNHNEHLAAGELMYVCMERSGYHRHVDFEHGHEVWTEIVEAAQ